MTPLAVVFRVDSSARMGSGHVARCLALARELARRGAEVRFVCREHPGHVLARVELAGFAVLRLPPPPPVAGGGEDYALWLGVPWAEDAEETVAALAGTAVDWLVVDHYGLDARWESRLRAVARRVLAIDDLDDRAHDCDLLLDQNYLGATTSQRYATHVPAGCRRLLGPTFALLAPEYAQLRPLLPPRSGVVRRILLFFGGGDGTADTLRVLEALDCPQLRHVAVDVVVAGAGGEALRARIEQREGITLHPPLRSLAGLLARADLAIGAGGSSSWERACLGVPALVATIAENQVAIASALHADGMQVLLGPSAALAVQDWRTALIRLVAEPARLGELARRASSLTDGRGAERVALTMVAGRTGTPGLTLRPAEPGDARLLFDWANDPLVRAMAFSTAAIDWEAHRRWFRGKLADPAARIYIATLGGEPVGQIRFDLQPGGDALVDVHTGPGLQGLGMGAQLIGLGVDRLLGEAPVGAVHAYIRPENRRSIRAFGKMHFEDRGRTVVDGHECVHLVRQSQTNSADKTAEQ